MTLQVVPTKLPEMTIRFKEIIESPLLIIPMIDTIKTFVLPTLDLAMPNHPLGEKQLMIIERHIGGFVDEAAWVRRLQVECHHASWRGGGVPYPSQVCRRKVLMIRSFA
jgi:hypothetical protein